MSHCVLISDILKQTLTSNLWPVTYDLWPNGNPFTTTPTKGIQYRYTLHTKHVLVYVSFPYKRIGSQNRRESRKETNAWYSNTYHKVVLAQQELFATSRTCSPKVQNWQMLGYIYIYSSCNMIVSSMNKISLKSYIHIFVCQIIRIYPRSKNIVFYCVRYHRRFVNLITKAFVVVA